MAKTPKQSSTEQKANKAKLLSLPLPEGDVLQYRLADSIQRSQAKQCGSEMATDVS